jgi:hypothetical protein
LLLSEPRPSCELFDIVWFQFQIISLALWPFYDLTSETLPHFFNHLLGSHSAFFLGLHLGGLFIPFNGLPDEWYAQQQNPYNLYTNQCFCCDFFHVLLLLAKQQQQKSVNLYTILVSCAWALPFVCSFKNKTRLASIVAVLKLNLFFLREKHFLSEQACVIARNKNN